MNIDYQIKEWASLCESENNTNVELQNEAYTKDVEYFEGKNSFSSDIGANLQKIGIENSNQKMYAITGSMIYWLIENLNKSLDSNLSPMERSNSLDHVRDIFGEKPNSPNRYWEEVQETEKNKKDREFAKGASEYYASKDSHDNFTGD